MSWRNRCCFLVTIFSLSAAVAAPEAKWYEEMMIGPALSESFLQQRENGEAVAALKGVLVDLGDRKAAALFDTETLRWVAVYPGFVDWDGTPWTGKHGGLIKIQNQRALWQSQSVVGWSNAQGSWRDERPIPEHGNIPAAHGRYLGYYNHGQRVVFHYEVLGADVLDMVAQRQGTSADALLVDRYVQVGARAQTLTMLLADDAKGFEIQGLSATSASGARWLVSASSVEGIKLQVTADHQLVVSVPSGADVRQVRIACGTASPSASPAVDLSQLTHGGPALHAQEVKTAFIPGQPSEGSAWAVDQMTLPMDNPWKSNLRFGGFDWIDANTAALCTWNGDVWTVKGLQQPEQGLVWRRIACGLFETLGLKVVDGVIYVRGRDQITRLHDYNQDGEIDYFEAFNRDVLITRNFHEFAFDLQTDSKGNFYFCKASPVRSGGRGFEEILPHHGIVAKVSADGKRFEVIATGLRAPGGLSIGPNDEITTGENEGTWQPRCKINFFRADEAPVFLGTEPSRQAIGKDRPFHEPLCYLPMEWDNSGGSQVWVPKGVNWGVKPGDLIHLSYGQSSLYHVLSQKINDQVQGGVVKIPVSLQSSAMRARFHADGSLYVLGFRGWQTNAATECAFQRIRYVAEKTNLLPQSMEVVKDGVVLHFDVDLEPELAADVHSFTAERWKYMRTEQYGSGEFSIDHPDADAEANALKSEMHKYRVHDTMTVQKAQLQPDGRSVKITFADFKPAMQMKIDYDLESKDGTVMRSSVVHTVKEIPTN